MLCDGLGRPLRFILTPGQKADCQQAQALLEGQEALGVIADKGYDTNAIRDWIAHKGMEAVIPSTANRKEPLPHDRERYKQRNRIERCFGTLKKHRRLATRFDRNDACLLSFVFLAASLLWL